MKEIITEKAIIRIISPDITKEKAAMRRQQIEKAAETILKSYGRRAKK